MHFHCIDRRAHTRTHTHTNTSSHLYISAVSEIGMLRARGSRSHHAKCTFGSVETGQIGEALRAMYTLNKATLLTRVAGWSNGTPPFAVNISACVVLCISTPRPHRKILSKCVCTSHKHYIYMVDGRSECHDAIYSSA